VEIRRLGRHEVGEVWSIDRAERIEHVYVQRENRLVLIPQRHDMKGWPPGEPEKYGPLLLDCFDHGGTFYGAFDRGRLVGAAVLEGRFIGCLADRLQLPFLHVSQSHRGTGLGGRLFSLLVEAAQRLGARQLYISSTTTENTVRFYLRRGCRPTDEIDAALFAIEPEDLHLEFDVPTRSTA
jgi:predicted N-acetyltransferase YhbS